MELFDISLPLKESLPTFPGDPPVVLKSCGGPFAVTSLALSSHSGTHLDLPGHVGFPGTTVGELPLEKLIGPCRVWDLCAHQGPLDAAVFSQQPFPVEKMLLLKTANSRLWREPSFQRSYQSLTPDGADWLVEQGVSLVGIDYLSIEAADGDGTVHRKLLQGGTLILEGLDLSGVPAGGYELICLPLKLDCDDGAPCRALLRRY